MIDPSALSNITLDLADVERTGKTASHGDPPAPYSDGYYGCLLHGFGANANDLVGLAPLLGSARQWVFPHAPIPITVAGMSYGRAWFPRESDVLQQAISGSYFQNLRALEPPGLSEAASAVRRLVDSQAIPWNRLILGGFSQGAIVSAEIIRQAIVDPSLPLPAAVLLFSGSLVSERWWAGLKPRLSTDTDTEDQGGRGAVGLPVFQSHGTGDGILPYEEGCALAEMLSGQGCALTFLEFDDGHTIPSIAVDAARDFLAKQLSWT